MKKLKIELIKKLMQLSAEERAAAFLFAKDKKAIKKSMQLKGQEKITFYDEYTQTQKALVK